MKNKEELSFEETIKLLKYEAVENIPLKVHYGPNAPKLLKVISRMEDDIKKAIDGKEIDFDNELIGDIETLCMISLTVFLTRPFEEREKNFFYTFGTLCFNWSQAANIDKESTTNKINALIIALKMHTSCIDLIESVRMINDVVQRYLRFDPPAYKVSRAYLESLYQELESGKLD